MLLHWESSTVERTDYIMSTNLCKPYCIVLGLEWIKDTPTQTFIINFLTQLKSAHSSLIVQSD